MGGCLTPGKMILIGGVSFVRGVELTFVD
ncbi:hypothetical protein ABIB25_005737, partial [Nakamurella sp. UYEF19]